MPIVSVGKGTSIAWTGAIGGKTGCTDIISFDTKDDTSLAKFLDPNVITSTRYRATKEASITIETHDIATWAAMFGSIGSNVTDLILTISSAVEGNGVATGTSATVTFSSATFTALGSLTHGRDDDSPAVASITFELNCAAGASQPTIAMAAGS